MLLGYADCSVYEEREDSHQILAVPQNTFLFAGRLCVFVREAATDSTSSYLAKKE